MSDYVPEIGQVCFGCPTGEFDVPDFASALVREVVSEIERVYWNRFQKQLEVSHGGSWPDGPIPLRAYWWGDDDAPEAAMPNLAFEGVEVRWYKYPGRGESCNREMDPAGWAKWFDACLVAIRAFDRETRDLPIQPIPRRAAP